MMDHNTAQKMDQSGVHPQSAGSPLGQESTRTAADPTVHWCTSQRNDLVRALAGRFRVLARCMRHDDRGDDLARRGDPAGLEIVVRRIDPLRLRQRHLDQFGCCFLTDGVVVEVLRTAPVARVSGLSKP